MALSATPRMKFPFLFANQTQKEVTVNEALSAMDALLCAVTPAYATTAPPATPANGDLYIVPAGATGSWAGKAKQVTWYSEGWHYMNPVKGLRVLDISTGTEYVYSGTDWAPRAGGGASAMAVKLVGGANTSPALLALNADDFEYTFAGGIGTLSLKAEAASAFKLAVEGDEVAGDAPSTLNFGEGFTITPTTGGYYSITFAGGGGNPLKLALEGEDVDGAAAATLNFGEGFQVTPTAGGYYTVDLISGGGGTPLKLAMEGDEVAGASATTLDFGAGFEVVATPGGYYAITFTPEAGGGVALGLAAGGVDVAPLPAAGDPPESAVVRKINFPGATITPTAGGYMTVSIPTGSAADRTVKNHTVTPANIQVDGFANQVVKLAANWAPQFSLAANHPGEKISGYLYVIQDATGGRTVTWPGNILWDSGIAPVLSLAPNKMDIFYFETISDDALNFVGFQVGSNINAPATVTSI